MPLIRGHHTFDDQFVQIPNAWMRDNRLSLKARGLLAQIKTHHWRNGQRGEQSHKQQDDA